MENNYYENEKGYYTDDEIDIDFDYDNNNFIDNNNNNYQICNTYNLNYNIYQLYNINDYNYLSNEINLVKKLNELIDYCHLISNINYFKENFNFDNEQISIHVNFLIDKILYYGYILENYIEQQIKKDFESFHLILNFSLNDMINNYIVQEPHFKEIKKILIVLNEILVNNI